MGIVYLISVIMLLIAFILLKKTEKEIHIISFASISIVALFCYNTFVCYILTFFTIPITLLLLATINILITILLSVKIIINREIQRYSFNKIDILYILSIALIVIIISYINFGLPLNVKYETSDPAVHYLTAVKFAESDSLLPGTEPDEVYGQMAERKTVSYVNSGLLMKCFCKNLEPMECYSIFVYFGIFTLYLTGVTIFSAMTNLAKKNEHRLWAFIVSMICMLGYPLNSFLFGFEYLSMGLLVICAIINLINYYEKEILRMKYFILLISLLNFGLFSSYYMFVPFMYPALWIYFYIKNYKKTRKILTKEIILLWLVTLIVPFILGFIYHLEPDMYAVLINKSLDTENIMNFSTGIVNSGFSMNGYIYINLYSNMLLLLPLPLCLTLYLFIKDAKADMLKNNYFIVLLLFFTMLFIEILLIGNTFRKVSIYYLSKNYFALWIILIYCNYKALLKLSEKGNYLPRLFIFAYVFLMIICTSVSNVKLVGDALNNPDENILSVMEIFGANKTMLFSREPRLNQDEINILMYARENLDYNSKIEVVTEGIQYYWSYVLLRYVNYEEAMDAQGYGQFKLNIKASLLPKNINKVDYIIYFNRSEFYKRLEDRLFENSEIIYENDAGGIIKNIK